MIIRGDIARTCDNLKACGFYLEFALDCESITLYRVTGSSSSKWEDTDHSFLVCASRVETRLERSLKNAK